jgi:hypothetical protein
MVSQMCVSLYWLCTFALIAIVVSFFFFVYLFFCYVDVKVVSILGVVSEFRQSFIIIISLRLIILALLSLSSAFFQSGSSGTRYYLGSEEVISVNNNDVNVGLVIAGQLSWVADASGIVISSHIFYVQQGAINSAPLGTATFSWGNSTWSSGQAIGGRFHVDTDKQILG